MEFNKDNLQFFLDTNLDDNILGIRTNGKSFVHLLVKESKLGTLGLTVRELSNYFDFPVNIERFSGYATTDKESFIEGYGVLVLKDSI